MRVFIVDGEEYMIVEAEWDMDFKVYRSDIKKAKKNDPCECIIALGIRRHPNVLMAHIGSGKHAYVIFKAVGRRDAKAVHFLIPADAARIRDSFDVKSAPRTQRITLHRPTENCTLDAQAAYSRKRKQELRDGSGRPARKYGPQQHTRMHRLGLAHRPSPVITSKKVEFETPVEATV